MTSTLNRGITNEIGLLVKYTPCAKGDQTDDELEEISIINPSKNESQGSPNDINGKSWRNKVEEEETGHMGSETNITVNGPRHLPGSCTPSSPNDRTKLIGERLSSSERISLSSPVYSGKVIEQRSVRSRTTSRQSIFELVRVKNRKPSRQDQYSLMRKVISNETVASKEVRKQRRKEIEENFFKKNNKPDIYDPADRDGCNWTFVFDPSGRLAYWWASVVSVAFLYNFWVIIYRFAFQEIHSSNIAVWFALDYLADLLYILDIVFHFRTGYLEDGVLQTDTVKLRIHYMNTTRFYIDCLCLLPLDFLYLSIGFCSILRCFRLVKVYRFWTFLDRTERHTNYPNAMRTLTLMHYLLALFHWNACLYYIVGTKLTKTGSWEFEQTDDGMRNDDRVIGTWQFPADKSDVIRQYLHALYWSTLTLTTIGGLPRPRTNGEYVFVIWELLFGLLLFATVLGHISNIVSSISAARKDFQAKLDGVKTYMSLRRVPLRLQDRVIRWFDYLWICNKSTDEEKTLSLLPDKLKAEIAIHVHLDTLKRVEIFQATEAGFLCELVLRLKPVLFSPGDYICTKGEVGKEMYIVNRGRLHVVADNGKTVLATLKPGSYFGEISILNMGTSGNRRTASVRSVGYSDLFRLSKQDLWDVLKEYPAARVRLEAIAVKRLEKTKKSPIEKASLCRSRSTPGLVESRGKVPLESMVVSRNNTLPTGLPTQSSSKMNSDPNIHTGSYTNISDDHVTEHQEIVQDVAQQNMTETQTSVTTATNVDPLGTSPIQPSLVGTDRGQRPIFQFSPPLTPRPPNSIPAVSCGSGTSQPPFSDSGSHEYMTYSSTAQVSPMHVQYPSYSQQYPCFNSQMPFLSPFSAHSAFIPPTSPNFNVSRSNNFTASHSPITASPLGSIRGYSPQQPINVHLPHVMSSMSPVSMYADTPQDVLTQEITRLRERLATLESENTSLHTKLNQQQWEVEHRLSELEMHICQTDMGSSVSTDDRTDRFETLNRESII